MAVESNRLAVQATLKRSQTAVYLPLYLFNETFQQYEKYNQDTQQWDVVASFGTGVDGQIILFQPSSNALYVLKVWFNGDWREVKITAVFINPDTGKPWNPLQNF